MAPDERVYATAEPLRSQQWGLDAVPSWPAADRSDVVVAVVDTGVDATHEDLAGIVLPVRVLDADGSGRASDVVEGIRWAADAGAPVMNLALGSTGPGSAYRDVMDHAGNEKGVVVVAATGNGYLEGNLTHYPAAEPDAIAVGATTAAGVRAPFSTTGTRVDLAAPGQAILAPCSSAKCGTTRCGGQADPRHCGRGRLLHPGRRRLRVRLRVGALLGPCRVPCCRPSPHPMMPGL